MTFVNRRYVTFSKKKKKSHNFFKRDTKYQVFLSFLKRFTPRTDHDPHHVDPNLLLWDAVQDLYSTAPTRQRQLDHTDEESICPERSRSSGGDRLSARFVKKCSNWMFLEDVFELSFVLYTSNWMRLRAAYGSLWCAMLTPLELHYVLIIV